jgi:hypothetical protein
MEGVIDRVRWNKSGEKAAPMDPNDLIDSIVDAMIMWKSLEICKD